MTADDRPVKISLGQPVHSTDGPFGELGDVVVDPSTNTVTHLVVEPHRRHYQARLIPMSLVDVADGVIDVRLDEAHVRSLQGVAESDFVSISEPIDLGEDWDVGVENILSLQYDEIDMMSVGGVGAGWSDHVTVEFDRIPKGECEIRRASRVMTSDDHSVGTVAGMVVDGDHVEGFRVSTGPIGFRHLVALPIGVVGSVRTDLVTLNIDRQTFRSLSPLDETESSGLAGAEHRVGAVAHRMLQGFRSKLHRTSAH